jgi:hypothetical protein
MSGENESFYFPAPVLLYLKSIKQENNPFQCMEVREFLFTRTTKLRKCSRESKWKD